MTSPLLDRIKGKKQEIKENRAGNTRTYKFRPGKTVISLLPLHDDPTNFFREFGQHFIKNRAGENVVAVGDRSICYPGEQCVVRDGLVELIAHGNRIGDDQLVKAAKESLSRKTLLVNGIVHQDPDKKAESEPQLLGFSEKQAEDLFSILEEYLEAEPDVLLRWTDRLLIIVDRVGTTKNDTKYTFYPAPKRLSVDPAIMSRCVKLDEFVAGQFHDSVNKALAYISTSIGRPVAGSTFAAALTAPGGANAKPALPSAVLIDDTDLLGGAAPANDLAAARTAAAPAMAHAKAVDAEFTEVAKPAAPTASPTADALLAEIDDLAA